MIQGTILLKTLTEKSIFQAGKFKGLPVGDALIQNKLYLISAYFSYSNLTFTEEILDKLKIKPEDRIKKPGNDHSKLAYYAHRNLFKMGKKIGGFNKDQAKYIGSVVKGVRRAKAKARYKGLIQREKISFSKSALQARNHGH